jgi:hypothetical protein
MTTLTTSTTSTSSAPIAELSTEKNRKLSAPELAILKLSTDQSLSGVTALAHQYQSESGPQRTATLKKIAALDPACVSYGPFGSPDGLRLTYCPTTSSDTSAHEEEVAGPAVTRVINDLRSANVSIATRVPNDLGYKLTVGSELNNLVSSLDKLHLTSGAARLQNYENTLLRRVAASSNSGSGATSTTSDGTGQPSTSSAPASAETVAVEECPSTYGYAGRHPIPTKLSAEHSASDQLMFYANSALAVLAPMGWSCNGAVGVDGSAQIMVSSRDGSQEVTASDGGACVSCNATIACPLISTAASALPTGVSCPSQAPAAEETSRISATTDAFQDPPYVHGTGTPSGGRYPANGVMLYGGHPSEAYTETCTLPSPQHKICTVILNDFLSRYP